MKIKGYDLAHEWALQVHNPQGAVFDLARFRNIQGFWSVANNLDHILAHIPADSTMHLLKAFARPFWPMQIPGGEWVIPIDEVAQASKSFLEVAMMVVGEVCTHSDDILGVILERFPASDTATIIVKNANDPSKSNDFTSRCRSVLDLDDHVHIEYRRSQSRSDAADPLVRERFRQMEESTDETPEPDISSCPAVLSYDRQFMKRMAYSEGCLDLPSYLRDFDWSSMTSSWPTATTFVTDWTAGPAADVDTVANDLADLEYIKVAEACLDAESRTSSPSNVDTDVGAILLRWQGCPYCTRAYADDDLEIIGPRLCPGHHQHVVHVSCQGEQFVAVDDGGSVVRRPVSDRMSVCQVDIKVGHLIGPVGYWSTQARAISHHDANTDLDTLTVNLPSSSSSSFAWKPVCFRMAIRIRLVASGLHWDHDIELFASSLSSSSYRALVDHGHEVVITLQTTADGLHGLSSLQYSFRRSVVVVNAPLPASTSGGQPAPVAHRNEGGGRVGVHQSAGGRWALVASSPADDRDLVAKTLYRRARQQVASRLLQDEMSTCRSCDLDQMVEALGPRLADLMMDPFGHYTAERLVQVANPVQRRRLLALGLGGGDQMRQVACHKLGSFSLQAMMPLLGHCPDALIKAMVAHLPAMMVSPSGHYVVLRYIDLFGCHNAIVDAARVQAVALASDHYGLRVMKVIVAHETRLGGGRPQVVCRALADSVLRLVENQYGNYIVQLVLVDGSDQDVIDSIYGQMAGRFAKLSKQKFSSNVVEKCIEAGTPARRGRVIDELIVAVGLLIRDRFGNYVLQKALEYASDRQMDALGAAINRHLYLLRDNVRSKWISILADRVALRVARLDPCHDDDRLQFTSAASGQLRRPHQQHQEQEVGI
ncbi:hypothetical protein PBRA_006940 [Plasmodiophora brassicae]|uniref:PUM-HD domain-containing protein n=1 Tax=Plasmodiophora brassicae TaxID=37360 RepID=A0A0G4IUQ4_PLABS|nr:hypothetical protein PBRA_006940 [Plasmodiophora brassicae]